MSIQDRESVNVLNECVDLQRRKSQDYQNPDSNIKQAMHYRRGVSTIHDMVQQKMYRAQSLLEPLENGSLAEPNFESLEDTYKDAINYLSFAVSYIRGKMEGQDPTRDMLNRPIPVLDVAFQPGKNPTPAQIIDRVNRRVADTYVTAVSKVGPIVIPEDEEELRNGNDVIVETYNNVVKDVGDRIDECFDPTMKERSEK